MMIIFQLKTNRITKEHFEEQLVKIQEEAKAMYKDEIKNVLYNGYLGRYLD